MTKKPTKGYVVDGRPMTADDLKRLHDYLADIEWIDVTSDEMRIVVESEWPEFIPQAAIETNDPKRHIFPEADWREPKDEAEHFISAQAAAGSIAATSAKCSSTKGHCRTAQEQPQ